MPGAGPGEAVARPSGGPWLGGDAGASGNTGALPGLTALADPEAPTQQWRRPDPLQRDLHRSESEYRQGALLAPPASEARTQRGTVNGHANGARGANGYHVQDAAMGANGYRPGAELDGGSGASGRHAKVSTSGDAVDPATGLSSESVTPGGLGGAGGVETPGPRGASGDADARTSAAGDEPTGEPGARPARRRAREDSPSASEDGAGAGRPVSELSFAELLAGALAAYREA
jgi:hypothetical protein